MDNEKRSKIIKAMMIVEALNAKYFKENTYQAGKLTRELAAEQLSNILMN